MKRVALIFDTTLRPETTGVYCQRALERWSRLSISGPRPGRIPREGFDLYLNIDDGLPYHLPPDLRPCAWWAIDTHLDFDRCREKAPPIRPRLRRPARRGRAAPRARDRIGRLAAAGLRSGDPPQARCRQAIRRRVRRQRLPRPAGRLAGPDPAAISATRSSASATSRRWPAPIRRRGWPSTAASGTTSTCGSSRRWPAGRCCVTNDLSDNGQAELFRDGVHLATYRDAEDLLDKLAFYLEREAIRERIAAAGRAEAIAKHTYSPSDGDDAADGGGGAVANEHRRPCRSERRSQRARRAMRRGRRRDPVPAAASRDPSLAPSGWHHAHALIRSTSAMLAARGPGAGARDRAAGPRHRLRRGAAGRGDQGAAAGRGRRHRARRGRRRGGAAAARRRSGSATSSGSTCDFPPGSFDAIVCADILEHLREPDRLLRQARAWLAPEGRLIASIPNVRHHSVVRSLLEGNWTYESAGLLDRTHLRFFTRREIEKLFYRAGFAIDEHEVGARHRATIPAQRNGPARSSVGRLSHRRALRRRGRRVPRLPVPGPSPGRRRCPTTALTSIVIVTHNQLEYTRQCLDSIRLLTDEPYELIVVDNGSTDGTVEYLRAAGRRAADRQRRQPRLPRRGQPGDRGGGRQPGPAAEQRRRGDDGLAAADAPRAAQRSRRSGWSGRAPTASAARSRSRSATTAWPTWTGSPGTGARPTTARWSTSTGWSASAC